MKVFDHLLKIDTSFAVHHGKLVLPDVQEPLEFDALALECSGRPRQRAGLARTTIFNVFSGQTTRLAATHEARMSQK